jgi:hypothetical protein
MMNPALVAASDDQFLAGLGYSNQETKKSQVNHQYAFLNGRFAKDYAKTGKAFGIGASFYQYGSVNPINPSPLTASFSLFQGPIISGFLKMKAIF